VAAKDIDAKVKEVSRGLSDTNSIDPARLRQAVADDLLQEALLAWLEENGTVTEKAAPEAEPESAASPESAATGDAKAKKEGEVKPKARKAAKADD